VDCLEVRWGFLVRWLSLISTLLFELPHLPLRVIGEPNTDWREEMAVALRVISDLPRVAHPVAKFG